jgi:putative membrane protein
MANERTHLAQLRTAVSLMSFGITLNRFGIYLEQSNRTPARPPPHVFSSLHDVENIGIGMVVLGVIMLAWSYWRYNEVRHQLDAQRFTEPRMGILLLTGLVILMGAGSAVWMIVG